MLMMSSLIGGAIASIALLSIASPGTAHADDPKGATGPGLGAVPLECRSIISHTVPSTVCKPLQGDTYPVRVLFRKMPAWNGNADLLLIDMCEYSPEGFQLVEDQLTVSADGKLPAEDPRLQPISCARKYCTEKSNAFGIAINALPIPIGWVSVKLWLGYQYEHFRVACESLEDTPQDAVKKASKKAEDRT
jgi:hypothetical protein